MRSFQKVREQLEQRLAVVESRREKVDRDLQRTPDPDSQEAAQEAENDEVLEELEARSRREIEQIRAALRRIDDGDYGTCAQCGEEIGDGRLEALPFTSLCIACAETAPTS